MRFPISSQFQSLTVLEIGDTSLCREKLWLIRVSHTHFKHESGLNLRTTERICTYKLNRLAANF